MPHAVRFKVRPINPQTDVPFVVSSWLASYRKSRAVDMVPNEYYYPMHRQHIDDILLHDGTKVVVAHAEDDPDHLLGFVCWNMHAPLIHYLYVKAPFRRLGVGHTLFRLVMGEGVGTELACTHLAPEWKRRAKKHNLAFVPYITGVTRPKEVVNE